MTKTAEEVLRNIPIYSDEQDYRLLQLPANAITLAAGTVAKARLPFSAIIVDKDEVSLLLPEAACQEFRGRLRQTHTSQQVYRLITFDAPLEPSLTGFIALVSEALAEADIPILTYAAYSRDHIFVPAEHFDSALETLRKLQQDSR